MKSQDGVVDSLKASLTIELTASILSFLAAKQCANEGLPRLHDHSRALSLEKMKGTERLVEHLPDPVRLPACNGSIRRA